MDLKDIPWAAVFAPPLALLYADWRRKQKAKPTTTYTRVTEPTAPPTAALPRSDSDPGP